MAADPRAPAPSADPGAGLCVCAAAYAFDARGSAELSLEAGDAVLVLELELAPAGDGWIFAESLAARGAAGYVPATYLTAHALTFEAYLHAAPGLAG